MRGGLRDFAATLEAETGVSLGKAYGRARTVGRAGVKAARWAAPRARELGRRGYEWAREHAVAKTALREMLSRFRRSGRAS